MIKTPTTILFRSYYFTFLFLVSCVQHSAQNPSTPSIEDTPISATSDSDRMNALENEMQELRGEVKTLKSENQTLKNQATKNHVLAQRPAAPARPDPKLVYAAPIDGAPQTGSKNALVTIVETFEYACPFCERSNLTMKRLLKKYKGDLRVVHQSFVVHPKARFAAYAACAAHKQNKFAKFDERLWKTAFVEKRYEEEFITAQADAVGLNMKRFRSDANTSCIETVNANQEKYKQLGVRGTPTFFINGHFLAGARPDADFEAVIDEELAKAREVIARNPKMRRSEFYAKEVLAKGQNTP